MGIKINKLTKFFVALFLVVAFIGCGDDDGDDDPAKGGGKSSDNVKKYSGFFDLGGQVFKLAQPLVGEGSLVSRGGKDISAFHSDEAGKPVALKTHNTYTISPTFKVAGDSLTLIVHAKDETLAVVAGDEANGSAGVKVKLAVVGTPTTNENAKADIYVTVDLNGASDNALQSRFAFPALGKNRAADGETADWVYELKDFKITVNNDPADVGDPAVAQSSQVSFAYTIDTGASKGEYTANTFDKFAYYPADSLPSNFDSTKTDADSAALVSGVAYFFANAEDIREAGSIVTDFKNTPVTSGCVEITAAAGTGVQYVLESEVGANTRGTHVAIAASGSNAFDNIKDFYSAAVPDPRTNACNIATAAYFTEGFKAGAAAVKGGGGVLGFSVSAASSGEVNLKGIKYEAAKAATPATN